jgi:hypothetical protein
VPFSSFWFVGALYVAWVSFTWVYFLLDFFSVNACWLDHASAESRDWGKS